MLAGFGSQRRRNILCNLKFNCSVRKFSGEKSVTLLQSSLQSGDLVEFINMMANCVSNFWLNSVNFPLTNDIFECGFLATANEMRVECYHNKSTIDGLRQARVCVECCAA